MANLPIFLKPPAAVQRRDQIRNHFRLQLEMTSSHSTPRPAGLVFPSGIARERGCQVLGVRCISAIPKEDDFPPKPSPSVRALNVTPNVEI